LRSAANAQYTLLDALTMRSVEPTFGLKSDSDDDAPECVAKDDMPDLPLPTHTKLLVRDSDADSAAPPLASSFYSYGSARVWGSVGWAAASPLVGVWMDRSGVNVVFAWTYAWSVVFVVLILMQPALCPTANYLVTATKDHRAPKRAPRLPQLLAAFKAFLLATETRNFLLHYMCFFFVLNIYDSVFWLHLEHSAAPSKAMIGWATSLQTVIELPVFLWADHLKRIFGVRVLLATARAALVARLLLSLFVAPGYGWVVLPVQALHGASFGLYKSISVDEAHRLAPPSLQASAQGAVAVAGVLVGRYACHPRMSQDMQRSSRHVLSVCLFLRCVCSAGSILWAAVYERHGSKMVYLGGAFLEVLGTALFLNQQQK
jgi:Na+/melibiose symporter-like transporter